MCARKMKQYQLFMSLVKQINMPYLRYGTLSKLCMVAIMIPNIGTPNLFF